MDQPLPAIAKTYQITIEGQTIPVPAEIGANDTAVKAALAPYFPDAANAMISRTEKDNLITVNVVKKAGSKGAAQAAPLAALRDAEPGQNPTIALYLELDGGQPDPLKLLELAPRIDQAIAVGEAHGKQLESALRSLRVAKTMPAPVVPLGF